MHCPFCGDEANRVVDTRLARDGEEIRRRRECVECGHRFTTRERVEQAYRGRIDEYNRPEEIRVRHILLAGEDTEARAEKALQRAGAGEDFAALARELSEDAATKEEGGDLGFFPRGRMLPPFEDAAFALQPGELS